jgi:hypothetical protein
MQHGMRKAGYSMQAVRMIQISGYGQYSRCAQFGKTRRIAHQAKQAITRA